MSSADIKISKVTYIYALYDPTDLEYTEPNIRYVGKSNNPQARLRKHMKDAKVNPGGRHCWSWINSLLKRNILPELLILECVRHKDWQDAERLWIEAYEDAGYNLTNMTAGGYGMLNMSDDVRQRIGQAASWHHANNPDFHEKAVANLVPGTSRPKNYVVSDATRRKLSVLAKESWEDDKERRDVMSKRVVRLWEEGVYKGHPHTAASKAKISKALKKITGVGTTQAKLSIEQVSIIRSEISFYMKGDRKYCNYAKVKDLANRFNVSVRTIKDCASYNTYP